MQWDIQPYYRIVGTVFHNLLLFMGMGSQAFTFGLCSQNIQTNPHTAARKKQTQHMRSYDTHAEFATTCVRICVWQVQRKACGIAINRELGMRGWCQRASLGMDSLVPAEQNLWPKCTGIKSDVPRMLGSVSGGKKTITITLALQKPLPNSRDETKLGVGCISSSVHVDQIPNGIDRR